MRVIYLTKRCNFALQYQKSCFFHYLTSSKIMNSQLRLTPRRSCSDFRSNPTPLKLHFNLYDPPKPTEKNPTVILHGLLGSKSNWKSLAKVIAGKSNRKVYVLDARNHGDSPHSETHDYLCMAVDVESFLEEHGIQKCVLLGHSMGGRTAMVVALQKTALVEKLVIVDVSPRSSSTENINAQMSSILDLVSSMRTALRETTTDGLSLSEVRRAVDQRMAQDIKNIGLRQFALTNLTEQVLNGRSVIGWCVNLEILANTLRSKNFQLPSSLDGIVYSGPTLFLCGGNSNYFSPEDHPIVRKFFPLSRIEYIKGAGHWVHSEKPTEFLDRLLPFL